MRKTIAMMLAMLLVILCGCSGQQSPTDQNLYSCGLEIIDRMDAMARSDDYLMMMSSQTDLQDTYDTLRAGNRSKPGSVYKLVCTQQLITSLLAAYDTAMPVLSEQLKSEVYKRVFASIPSYINSRAGAYTLAATSIINASDSFIDKGLTDSVIYFYLFDDAAAAVVLFTPGSEGTVVASGSFIVDDALRTGISATELSTWLEERIGLSDANMVEVAIPM